MAEKLLEFTVVTYTANQLAIKVKNISAASLDQRFVIDLCPTSDLVNDKIEAAAKAAAQSKNPPGAKSLAGLVTGPQGWSVWVRRETSDAALYIVFINDMDQNGKDMPPVKIPAGAEFTINIPLDPTATRGHIDLLYSYQLGEEESMYGKLELKPEHDTWTPVVELYTKHRTPTMVKPGDPAQVIWKIENGVSATLRGPLPGGNSELSLSTKPDADFKLGAGSVDIRVMGTMTYVLEAEVKRVGHANVQVVRMLTFDTKNDKYLYLSLYPDDILPHGLLEINWAAWGVEEITLNVSTGTTRHTTRTIQLTQQTKGRSYEGTGVMRVSASKSGEKVVLSAETMKPQTEEASVVTWEQLAKSDIKPPLAMALVAPKLAVLTADGLSIFQVGETDPDPRIGKLAFIKTSTETPRQWLSLTAGDNRFVVLRRTNQDDLEVAPYNKNDGKPEAIAPVTLPANLRPLVAREGTIYDCVGFRGRVYVVIEAGLPDAKVRRAFSVGFDGSTNKSESRPEPLLEPLAGYRLLTFDGSLYALQRVSGRMFRFDLTTSGTLEEPRAAASAVREDTPQRESMIREGVFVPLGRTLAVLSPSSVPSVTSLDRFGLHNVLGYLSESTADPSAPQDLVYNPQKNYWARCGHDVDIKQGAVSAYRPIGSRRLWVIQPDGATHTLAVGSESLFAHDYVSAVPTAALPPYLDKKREFTITNSSGMNFVAMSENYHNAGLTGFSASGPDELVSRLPERLANGSSATVQFRYNDADPTPMRLRFLVQRAAGVKHDYFVEVTFSGPGLATATSVFKRIAEDTPGGLSVAEIPGTTVKHATDKPIVLPIPKLLVEGVRLRCQNATPYTLWRQRDQGQYAANDVITYNTPVFSVYAHGAGHVQVNVDFSLPSGIEIASAGAPQRKLISLDDSRANGLRAQVLQELPNNFEFRISYVGMSDMNAAYIGDGVANARGEALYIPVSIPDNQSKTQILKVNPENLTVTAMTHSILYSVRGGFAIPNSIAVTNDAVLALFDNEVWLMDTSLQIQTKFPYLNSMISAFVGHPDGDVYMIETNPNIQAMFSNYSYHFQLLRGHVRKNSQQQFQQQFQPQQSPQLDFSMGSGILLDDVRSFSQQPSLPGAPFWVPTSTSPVALSPSAVSTRGERIREAAVCIAGGVFVVGSDKNSIRSLALQSTRREEAVVYGRDGLEIYCAHSQSDNEGLRITRVDNKAWKQTHTLSLPRGEGVANLTTDTRQRKPQDRDKESRSASMVISGDGKWLYVSHGRSIFKIEAATLALRDTFKVDLPCRLFHVGWGKPTQDTHPLYGGPSSCTLLYALGASYIGDGKTAKDKQFKTHLYKIAVRD